MEPWVSKVISLILTFAITLVSGLLPIKLIRVIRPKDGHAQRSGYAYRADVIISYLNCFSGGVFLAVTLLHLLPDVRADLTDVLEALHQTSDFPLAEFIACIGFFIVMLLEHGVMQYQRSSKTAVTAKDGRRPGESCARPIIAVDTTPAVDDNQSEKSTSDTSSSTSEGFLSASTISDSESAKLIPLTGSDVGTQKIVSSSCRGAARENEIIPQISGGAIKKVVPAFGASDSAKNVTPSAGPHAGRSTPKLVSASGGGTKKIVPTSYGTMSSCARRHEYQAVDVHEEHSHDVIAETSMTSSLERHRLGRGEECERRGGEDAVRGRGAGHAHHSHGLDPDDLQLHSMRSLVLLIALSTHTIFEGMALGLQDTTSKVWTLFTAIILHKAIMSFTAGLRFVETLPSLRRTVLYVIFFSLTAPVGIAIGIAVSESGTSGLATSIASSALQGVATGTFIYVTFFEVLLDEMSTNHNIAKVFAVILGFTCIAGLELVTED